MGDVQAPTRNLTFERVLMTVKGKACKVKVNAFRMKIRFGFGPQNLAGVARSRPVLAGSAREGREFGNRFTEVA